MFVTEIKEYIYKNGKIPFVLENLGCKKIEYHNNKDYYSACFKDGDNPMGVTSFSFIIENSSLRSQPLCASA